VRATRSVWVLAVVVAPLRVALLHLLAQCVNNLGPSLIPQYEHQGEIEQDIARNRAALRRGPQKVSQA
jgi:hypothetical protein